MFSGSSAKQFPVGCRYKGIVIWALKEASILTDGLQTLLKRGKFSTMFRRRLIICRILLTAQYVRYTKSVNPLPNISTGNMTTRKEPNATANVPLNTIIALIATNRKELETKVAKTTNGRNPRAIKTARNTETNGRFWINSLSLRSTRIPRQFFRLATRSFGKRRLRPSELNIDSTSSSLIRTRLTLR